MSIHIQGTYKDGVIYPEHPLGLPENSLVDLTIDEHSKAHYAPARETAANGRPVAPQFSPDELSDRVNRYAVHVGSLPTDFSRADIYQGHD